MCTFYLKRIRVEVSHSVRRRQRFHHMGWLGLPITKTSNGFSGSWSEVGSSDVPPGAHLAWHQTTFLLLMHSLYTFKYCLLQACVESQPVFTAQPIKEAQLKYSLWECSLGNDVIHPDSRSPYRRYTVFLGCKVHIWCHYGTLDASSINPLVIMIV